MVDDGDGNVQLGKIGSPKIKIKGNIKNDAQIDNKSCTHTIDMIK